jgi:cytochrome c-type biogenesis protein CcmE
MTPTAKLAFGIGIVVAVTIYMAYAGASTSWRYYVTVDECVARHVELTGSRLRVSGWVVAGSLQVSSERSCAAFVLRGTRNRLNVTAAGPLPDNLEEGAEVVVEGTLTLDGVVRAEKVLTKCASKYEQPRAEETSVPLKRPGGKELP